jgi:ABC-type multidrug transport system fused ATPase/permease subunit
MLRTRNDLPDAELPAPAPAGRDLTDPASGVHIRQHMVTALVAAEPKDATTIADRLGRYDPDSDVTLAGVPLKDLDLRTVRERILVADNDARLFAGSLRADLDPQHTGRVREALTVAAADDIVDALPDGLDAEVAERGREFSGGQQQRLRLVRALVADPDVLVLVEPTSAVDAHTEARIADRLGTARRGRTTVICSTSPLVLDRADHVLYVEAGTVVAEGTHRDLVQAEPRYARTVLRDEEAS